MPPAISSYARSTTCLRLSGSAGHKHAALAFIRDVIPEATFDTFNSDESKDTPLSKLFPHRTNSTFTPRDLVNSIGAGLIDPVDNEGRTWPVMRDQLIIQGFLRDNVHNLLVCDDARVPSQIDNFPEGTIFIRLNGGHPQNNIWDTGWEARKHLFHFLTPDHSDPTFAWLRTFLKEMRVPIV